eukprot:5457050-Prymnesium_polylepis.1
MLNHTEHNAALPAGLRDDCKPEERVLAWKALLLEGWMRKHNFRAAHPVGPDRWPAPEGTAAQVEPSPLTARRASMSENDIHEHLTN